MSEKFVHDVIESLSYSDKIALDIGTAEGEYAEILQRKFKAVYAFDPNPDFNTGSVGNAFFVPKAISEKTGRTKYYLSSLNRGRNTTNESHVLKHLDPPTWGYSLDQFMMVDCISIDDFCKDMEIGFIKCDIEGGEEFIFKGAVKTLKNNTMDVIIEFHDNIDYRALRDFFTRYGYQIFKEPEIPGDKMYHYLFSNRYM